MKTKIILIDKDDHEHNFSSSYPYANAQIVPRRVGPQGMRYTEYVRYTHYGLKREEDGSVVQVFKEMPNDEEDAPIQD